MFFSWTTPQLIPVFSENKPGYLENVGFIFQQLDLYMQALRLGVCWLGMGKLSAQGTVQAKKGDTIHVYCAAQGIFKAKSPSSINLIDMEIALAHMYITNPDKFSFFKADKVNAIKGYD